MYNKIYKNYQVNVGNPFQIKHPVHIHTVRDLREDTPVDEPVENPQESPEDILQKAREEAEMIVKEAEYETERLIQEAAAELDKIRQAAEEEARQKGYEDGFNEGKRQYEQLISEVEAVKEQAIVEYREVLAGIETDAVGMIMEIARKVIGNEISANRESILYMVKQAFDKCTNKEDAVLKLSIEDYEYINSHRDRLVSMVEGLGEFEVKKDPALKNGDCIIETSFGSVDAGVETKLKKIEEAFSEVIGK